MSSGSCEHEARARDYLAPRMSAKLRPIAFGEKLQVKCRQSHKTTCFVRGKGVVIPFALHCASVMELQRDRERARNVRGAHAIRRHRRQMDRKFHVLRAWFRLRHFERCEVPGTLSTVSKFVSAASKTTANHRTDLRFLSDAVQGGQIYANHTTYIERL